MADKIEKTPLESWIRAKTGCPEDTPFSASVLAAYQMEKIRETFAYVKERSPFYRNLLAGIAEPADFDEFSGIPFTYPRDVREKGMKMLCVSQGEIARVVTLATSGTTGEAKRLFFTEDDLELTIDFFSHGMTTMVGPGDTVIVFLPGARPDNVGDLLARGLVRIGVEPVIHGPISDLALAREEVLRHPGACLVGIPTQILSLARTRSSRPIPTGGVGSVLLSTDYVPAAIMEELERRWKCPVFTHYGMTETGYGAAVECMARAGYHMREADLYFEIVDPSTGAPCPDGEWGEAVFTTLTRSGMPLVRYRTGDRARMLPGPCPCGTTLRRMDRLRGRIGEDISLAKGVTLTIQDLDEALFRIDGVLNYGAEVSDSAGCDEIRLSFYVDKGAEERVSGAARQALEQIPSIRNLLASNSLTIGGITFRNEDWFTTGVGKRKLRDARRR